MSGPQSSSLLVADWLRVVFVNSRRRGPRRARNCGTKSRLLRLLLRSCQPRRGIQSLRLRAGGPRDIGLRPASQKVLGEGEERAAREVLAKSPPWDP